MTWSSWGDLPTLRRMPRPYSPKLYLASDIPCPCLVSTPVFLPGFLPFPALAAVLQGRWCRVGHPKVCQICSWHLSWQHNCDRSLFSLQSSCQFSCHSQLFPFCPAVAILWLHWGGCSLIRMETSSTKDFGWLMYWWGNHNKLETGEGMFQPTAWH